MTETLLRNNPCQARSQLTLTAILDAAERLVAEAGQVTFTAAELAAAAGMSIGRLYYWYPDLASVMSAVRGESTEPAKAVCRGCVVRLDCLEYALDNGEKFGIWGGLSERERGGLRRTRRVARRQSALVAAGRPNLRVVSDV